MGLSIDTTPLRQSRDFRRLWVGQAVSFAGSVITMVAVPFQVFRLTGSSLAVGLLGLAEIVPMVGMGLVGGAAADAFDRRRVLLAANGALALCSLTLTLNAVAGPHLWLLYVVAGISAGLAAVSSSALRSLIPRLVPTEQRPAAFALNAAYASLGMTVGPVVGGVLVAVGGFATAYVVDTVTFAAA